MAASKRLHLVVEWLVAEDFNNYVATSGTPTADEVDAAYAYAVENDCVVKLTWTACNGHAGWHHCYVHASTDVVRLKNELERICYAV